MKRFPNAPKTFTTHPKTRRHKQYRKGAVRRRAEALRDSFHPAEIVSYKAAERRLKQMDLCDRTTILSYLGRPESLIEVTIDQNVNYAKSGVNVAKKHKFRRTLPAKEGYITTYDLGTLEVDEWGTAWILWNHEAQVEFSPHTPLSEVDEKVKGLESGANGSKSFSLSFNSGSSGGGLVDGGRMVVADGSKENDERE